MANVQGKRQQQPVDNDYLAMRAEHRVKLANLVIEIDDDHFADKSSGLLDGPSLKEGLTVHIPKWLILPPPEKPETVVLKMAIGTGGFDREVGSHVFTIPAGGTDFKETFPFAMTIDVNDLPDDANIRLQYTFTNFTGEENPSQITSLICDRMPPYKHAPPLALTFVSEFLDDTNVPVDGKVDATVPGYADWKAGDKVAIYLVDSDDIPEDPTDADLVYFGDIPGTSDTKVEIDANIIRRFGDAKAVFICVLIDKALNPSAVSIQKEVFLTFGALPDKLVKPRVPQATPGPLTNEDVRNGVSVWIDKYDNYKRGDDIRLKWGATTLEPDFPIPDNSMPNIEIPVTPALLMLQEYGQAQDADELIHHLQCTPCDLLISDYSMPYGHFPDGLALMGCHTRIRPG